MALRRIDPLTVVDDTGASFWMPDLSAPVGDGVTGSPVSPGSPTAAEFPWPTPEVAQDFWPSQPGPPGMPPDMTDPTSALMVPGSDSPMPGLGQVDAISGTGPIAPQTWEQPPGAPGAPAADALPALPTLGAAPGSVAEADAQETAAFNEATGLAQQAAMAKQAEATALMQRQATAAEQSVAGWDAQKAENDKLYAAEAEKADQETADWLKEMQTAASAQVDTSRYFSNRTVFSKVAWVVGIVASSIAAGADQSKNISIKMLKDAVDQDVALQQDEIRRKMDATKVNGAALDRRQDRAFTRLGDNESAAWQRWAAVEKIAMAKAAIPGAESMRAGYLQAAAEAGAQKMAITEKRATRAHSEAEARAARSIQWANHSQTVRANDRADREQLIGVAQHEEDRADKYALAAISASGKAGAGGIEQKDLRTIDRSTGFRIRHKDGREEDIVLPKEQHKEVVDRVEAISQELSALGDLRKALKTADWSGRVFKTDGEFVAAVENMAGPRVKLLNKGATTEADIARSYKSFLGYDPNSVISTGKGPSKDEMMVHLDKQIDVAVRKAPQAVRTHGGFKIPEGADVVFTPRQDLNIVDPPVPTPEDDLAAGGVTTPSAPRPTSTAEVRRGHKLDTVRPGTGLPDLPPDLGKVVQDFTVSAGKYTPRNAAELAEDAKKAINAWASRTNDPSAKEAAQDARLRVDAAKEDALARSHEALEAVRTKVKLYGGKDPGAAAAYVKSVGTSHGLNLTTEEIRDLVKEAEAAAKKGGRLPKALGGDK